jgi:hypothetical protein
MIPDPSHLRKAFVEAYPSYVARVLHERGIPLDEVVADAIVEGAAVLDGLLTTLEGADAFAQRHSPLELFREALRPVDHALAVTGVEPPSGVAAPRMAPWDRFGLSPGSSQVLGAEAHEAHLAWALTKARIVAPSVNRPGAAVIARDPVRTALADAVEGCGYRIVPSEEASIVVVDAGAPDARDVIATGPTRGRHIIVVGSVDDLTEPGLRALGADVIVEYERFVADPGAYLPLPS